MVVGFLVFAFFLLIYSLGVSPSSFGGDSGDIIISYFFGGVSHPPGYPLNTLLGYLLTHGLFQLTGKPFVYLANYTSAIYLSISLGLLYILLIKLTKDWIAAIFAVCMLGFSVLFWVYAHTAEVFQLTLILILLSLIFLIKFNEDLINKKTGINNLYFSVFFLGLAVFHHHTAVLLLPAYIYFLRKVKLTTAKYKINYLKILFVFCLGIIPYIYDIWQGFLNNPYNWSKPTTLDAFVRLITRADYGTFSASKDLVGLTFKQRYLQIVWYLLVLKADFGFIGLLFSSLGAIYLYFKNNKYFWFFALSWLFTGPFFLFYSSFPILDSFTKGVAERFVLTSYLFIAIFMGFGAIFFILYSKKILFIFVKNPLFILLVSLLILLIPLKNAYLNWDKTNLSDYEIGGIFARDILSSANPPGIIVPGGDTPAFNMKVSYAVEGINSESAVVENLGKLGSGWYRKTFMENYPNLIYPANFRSNKYLNSADVSWEFFKANVSTTPVYFYDSFIPPEGYQFIQEGMLFRLYRTSELPDAEVITKSIVDKVNRIQFNYDFEKNKYEHFFADQIYGAYKRRYLMNGNELLKLNKYSESRVMFDKALAIDNKFIDAVFTKGVSFIEENDCLNAKIFFDKTLEINNEYWQAFEGLARYEVVCTKDEQRIKEHLRRSEEIQRQSGDVFLK